MKIPHGADLSKELRSRLIQLKKEYPFINTILIDTVISPSVLPICSHTLERLKTIKELNAFLEAIRTSIVLEIMDYKELKRD
jgi:hypothetical protein